MIEERKIPGFVDIDDDTMARKALVKILRNRKQVFSFEAKFIDRMEAIFRRLTIWEADWIFSISGRLGKERRKG